MNKQATRLEAICFVLLSALVLGAFAVRVYRLSAQDIWWDEGRNLFTASRPLEQIAGANELDIHPPLYFYLLHMWVSVAGVSEFTLRFFSLWFGVATVALAFRFGAYWSDSRSGLWAAYLTALAPFLVDEAQQARMYTLLVFLSALATLFLVRAVRSGRTKFWLFYILTAAASFYTHYSFVYVLAAQILFLLWQTIAAWRNRAPARLLFTQWVTSQIAIAALYLPQVPNILRQSQIYGNPGMTPPSLSFYASELMRAFLIGVKVEPERATLAGMAILIVLVAAIVARLLNRVERGLRGGELILLWLVVPLMAYYVVLQFSPQFTPRYAMIAAFPLYLLIAVALGNLSRRSMAAGALAASIWAGANIAVLQSQFFNPEWFNDDTRGVANFISQKATQDDVVLIDVPFPFEYYYRGSAPAQYFFVDIHTAADDLTRLTRNKQRVFWIHWFKADTDPRGVVPYLLDKHAVYLGDQDFRGYNVVWYQLSPNVQFSLTPAPKKASALFSDRMMLTGFAYGGVVTSSTPDPDAPRVKAGSKAWVTLWWRLAQTVREDYKVSIQIRDANGNLAAQDDRILINDRHWGTRLWGADETVINVYTPELLDGILPGEYVLNVIVYDPESGQRLQVGNGDTLTLGKIRVVP